MGLSPAQQHLFNFLNMKKIAPLQTVAKILEESLGFLGLDNSSLNEKLLKEIAKINETIRQYNLEIVGMTDEITCEKVFILINTGDNVSQKSLFYNESTTHFFSKIVKECVLSEEGFLSETQCLNLNSQARITKSEAQSILEKLIKDKWLDSVNDKISLGMRSLAELEQSIKDHYPNNVKSCPFCKLTVLQGYICHNCKIKAHFACWKKYFTMSKNKCTCPSCKTIWSTIPSHIKIDDPTEEEADDNCASIAVHQSKRRKK